MSYRPPIKLSAEQTRCYEKMFGITDFCIPDVVLNLKIQPDLF